VSGWSRQRDGILTGARTVQDGLGRRGGETPQKVANLREHHRVHDPSTQGGYGGFSGSIGDIHHVALPLDGDIADTRMPYQGPAHVQHSQTAEKAVDLEGDTASPVRLVKDVIAEHLHVRPHPQIV
jgi:hypothetical protein